jgi:hypothetical protein
VPAKSDQDPDSHWSGYRFRSDILRTFMISRHRQYGDILYAVCLLLRKFGGQMHRKDEMLLIKLGRDCFGLNVCGTVQVPGG